MNFIILIAPISMFMLLKLVCMLLFLVFVVIFEKLLLIFEVSFDVEADFVGVFLAYLVLQRIEVIQYLAVVLVLLLPDFEVFLHFFVWVANFVHISVLLVFQRLKLGLHSGPFFEFLWIYFVFVQLLACFVGLGCQRLHHTQQPIFLNLKHLVECGVLVLLRRQSLVCFVCFIERVFFVEFQINLLYLLAQI